MSDQESTGVHQRKSSKNYDRDDDSDEDRHLPSTRKRREHREGTWSLNTVVLFLLLGCALVALGWFTLPSVMQRLLSPKFTPNAIVVNIPRRTCLLVDEHTIIENQRNPRWQRVVQSMQHYLDVEGLEGISAFHLGEADCYIMLRMKDNSTLSMYNARFTGFDQRSISVRPEQSLACPSITRTMKRSDVIIASYIDAQTARPILIRLEDEVAWAFQHVNAYSLGKTICDLHAENTDKEIEGLREYIVE